ncbi:hypothetical protein [Tateyamaria sp. SN6-1]|uniref:hypothetical protein n=1 Tax=Tateyamaria sp. SN6-1 TaxID=3092148 RepID=UPI0039F63184
MLATPALAQTSDQTGHFHQRSYLKESVIDRAVTATLKETCADVEAGKLYQFVDGRDTCLTALDAATLADINSAYATGVLKKGLTPDDVAQIVEYVDAANIADGHESFLVAEGGQIPLSIAPRDAPRNYRYVVAWDGDVFLSAAPGGDSSFLQVISWDETAQHFDFFEYRQQVGSAQPTKVWSWAGRSDMSQDPQLRGRGCFDCHTNGVTIMKELVTPWNNWQSQTASIAASHVPEAVANEALFQNRTGAEVLEGKIKGAVTTFHNARIRRQAIFDRATKSFTLSGVPGFLRHATQGTTTNFVSSQIRSTNDERTVTIPLDLLLADDLLRSTLGIDYKISPDALTVPRDIYADYIAKKEYALVQAGRDGPLYVSPGSTYFTGFVPGVSFEDVLVIRLLQNPVAGVDYSLIPPKFFAAIAMTDFPNPLFSDKRSALQAYADQIPSGRVSPDENTVVDDFVKAVTATAQGQAACDTASVLTCSPEQQFLHYWSAGDDWQSAFGDVVMRYFEEEWSGPDAATKLLDQAEAARTQFAKWPIISNLNEFSLLLPEPGAAN